MLAEDDDAEDDHSEDQDGQSLNDIAGDQEDRVKKASPWPFYEVGPVFTFWQRNGVGLWLVEDARGFGSCQLGGSGAWPRVHSFLPNPQCPVAVGDEGRFCRR